MPAGIKDAFKSPFDQRNPTSRFHDINSFTKSSSTNSIRNEYYQANTPNVANDFNNNYQINKRLPDYQPYPTMHPINDYSSGNLVNQHDNESDSSIVRDPHQGACWKHTTEPSYLVNGDTTKKPISQFEEDDLNEQSTCDDLINKVLTNKYCRQMLRKILIEENIHRALPPFRGGIEGFTNFTNLDQNTVKNIIIYFLGGILILFFIELLIRFGQLLKK